MREGAHVGRVGVHERADGGQARVDGGGQPQRLLGGKAQLVAQDGGQPAALGTVVAGVTGVGEDQLAQQWADSQDGRMVEAERRPPPPVSAGVGVAAYHPEAARVARAAAHGRHTGMGWFSFGGNAGFALAPLLVFAVLATGGLRASPLLVVPALAAALCAAVVRSAGSGARSTTASAVAGEDDWGSFLRLSGAVVCRSVVFVGLGTFVSLYVRERTGGGVAAGTAALFVLYAGGAAGKLAGGRLAGGRLAGQYGRMAVVRRSYALTVLAVAGLVLVPGPPVYLFVALTSAGLYVPFSLHITLSQDFLPRRVGTASGVTLGLAVSVGGLAVPALGALADATSLRSALLPLVALPALGRLLLCGLREPAPPGAAVTVRPDPRDPAGR
ncbi:hypothetical protein GCM10010103_59160 [Streptomyces paradoxus]